MPASPPRPRRWAPPGSMTWKWYPGTRARLICPSRDTFSPSLCRIWSTGMTGKVRFATIVAVALLTAASASAQEATPAPAPASTSEVATVKSTNGKVLLNRATAYDPAAKDQRLVVGDRLVVLEGGAITVRFDDGCDQIIDRPSIYTVPSTS